MDKTQPTQATLAPIEKSIKVDLPLEQAFHLFTDQAGRWWPLATHSVGGEQAETCILEGRVGGRFYEVNREGSESEWGQVLVWEPPHRLVTTFYPGRTPDYATELEVAFEPEAGGTRVTLTHRGWERCAQRLGEAAKSERAGYDRGWDFVLGKYLERAAS